MSVVVGPRRLSLDLAEGTYLRVPHLVAANGSGTAHVHGRAAAHCGPLRRLGCLVGRGSPAGNAAIGFGPAPVE